MPRRECRQLPPLLLSLVFLASETEAVRQLDVTAPRNALNGLFAFADGETEATCKACTAVMDHIEARLSGWEMSGGGGGEGKNGSPAEGSIGMQRIYQRSSRTIRSVIDPHNCDAIAAAHHLERIDGESVFAYREATAPMADGAPTTARGAHAELDAWTRQELTMFCLSLLEEHEDDLAHLLSSASTTTAATATTAAATAGDAAASGTPPRLSDQVCKRQLSLCRPPPPRRFSPREVLLGGAKSEEEYSAMLPTTFELFDADGDGFLTRGEGAAGAAQAHSTHDSRPTPQRGLLITTASLSPSPPRLLSFPSPSLCVRAPRLASRLLAMRACRRASHRRVPARLPTPLPSSRRWAPTLLRCDRRPAALLSAQQWRQESGSVGGEGYGGAHRSLRSYGWRSRRGGLVY
jgi:hypothetical protein